MKRGTRKFTKPERRQISALIREFLNANPGADRFDIAEHLTAQGIAHPNSEWNNITVGGFLNSNPVRRSPAARSQVPVEAVVDEAPAAESDVVAVAELVLASNLDRKSKERCLRALLKGE